MTGPTEPRGFFSLPPGADFARAFALGFHARHAHTPPQLVARGLILTNSGRTRRLIEEALADTAQGPCILPGIASISQLFSDPLRLPDAPPAIAPMRRRLRLTRLVEAYLRLNADAGEAIAPMSAAGDLAESLALLIDQLQDEGIDADTLEQAVLDRDLSDESAAHWQKSLRFVDIVRSVWPGVLHEEESGAQDPRARQSRVIDALVADWQAAPPETPVIAVGSTGSVASTARLLRAIADLPRGAVVLPGFDPSLDPDIWQAATPEHPMGPFHRWMHPANISPASVQPWADIPTSPRAALMTQALRPAPVTDHWHAAADQLRGIVAPALDGMTLIEAENAHREAEAVALTLREVIAEPDQRVTLITPDAAFARRVTVKLSALGIVPDDTSGQPLSATPPGTLFSLILDAAAGRADAVGWAALLAHPLCQPGLPRNDHLVLARAYERAVLRETHLAAGQAHLPCCPEKLLERHPEAEAWLARINTALSGLTQALACRASLAKILSAHIAAARQITDSGSDGSEPALWRDEAGGQLQTFLDRLQAGADAFGEGAVADYAALLNGLMRGETVRPRPREPHPRVAIRGPREARIEAADTVVLAGLNEGTWPAPPDPGPWLSRPMHEAIGLPLPERSVGLSAHDFQQAACQPRVILSRSKKLDGAPTVASRWLIRMQTLVEGIGESDAWTAMQRRGDRYLAIAQHLARPDAPVERARRPAPVLPAIPEPRRISVTDIETLIRDAYAIYAKKALRLVPMNPLSRGADARDRGNVMHAVMEQFTRDTVPWPGPEIAHRRLLAAADGVLAAEVVQPDLRRVWRARILRFADWFIAREADRRAAGDPMEPEVQGNMVIGLPHGPLEIRAKADRIDRLLDGSAAIYDYKTGAPPSEKQIGSFNHQLHLQAAILAADGFEGIPPLEASGGAYIGLTGSGKGGEETRPRDLPGEVPIFVERVREMLAAYDAGAPWTALGRPHRQAYESDYDHLSRRGEWAGEDDE